MQADLEKGTKVCTRCGQEKPLEEFYKSAYTKDGYRPHCIECAKQLSREAMKKAREKRRDEIDSTKPKSYRKLTASEKKALLSTMRSDNPLSAYHPRELFEYLQSLGYKIKAEYTQTLTFG